MTTDRAAKAAQLREGLIGPSESKDQFALGVPRTEPTRRDLALALEKLLAGKEVSVAETEPVGCRISRVRRPGEGEVTRAARGWACGNWMAIDRNA